MGIEKELESAPAVVMNILKRYPATRDCDPLLYVKVASFLNPIVLKMSFEEVMLNLEDLGLWKFETVRRTRQKIQAEHPELKACETVQGYRADNEEVFKEFSRN